MSATAISGANVGASLTKKNEQEVQHEIVEWLRKGGWIVRTFNQPKAVKTGIRGWVDVVAIKHNRVIFIEVKAQGKRKNLRPSQAKLRDELKPHTGCNVFWIVADNLEAIQELVNDRVSYMRQGDCR